MRTPLLGPDGEMTVIIGRGAFTPGVGHDLRGGFTLTRQGDGVLMRTTADFFFDGSPEPGWALAVGLPIDANDPAVRAAGPHCDRKPPVTFRNTTEGRISRSATLFLALMRWSSRKTKNLVPAHAVPKPSGRP